MALAATDGALGRQSQLCDGRRTDRWGTLIRHASPTLPFAATPLANQVSVSARFGSLISTVDVAPLLPPSRCAAFRAAIALTTVATAAHKEERTTASVATKPRAQRGIRHCLRISEGNSPQHTALDAARRLDQTLRSLLTKSGSPLSIEQALPRLRQDLGELQDAQDAALQPQ